MKKDNKANKELSPFFKGIDGNMFFSEEHEAEYRETKKKNKKDFSSDDHMVIFRAGIANRLEQIRTTYSEAKDMNQEELNEFWMSTVMDRERELKAKERTLKEREAKLEAEKKKLKETRKGSYRVPKHLINAITGVRPATGKEIDLFSRLDETITTSKTLPIIGLDLTIGERKLVNCFSLMLHQRSQTIDASKDNYYAGEANKITFQRYGSNDIIAPKPELRTTLYEITKLYTNKSNPSGGELDVVKNILFSLFHKGYNLRLTPTIYKENGEKPKRVTWMDKLSLFSIGTTENKNELYIHLSSFFALQIRNYYVNYPQDFSLQLEEAYSKLYPKNRVTIGVYTFIDHLASVRGVRNIYKHEIYKSNLYEIINYKWLEKSKIRELKEVTKIGIDIAKEIGLLEKYEEVTGITGELKYIFYTRKDWIKR